MLGEPVAERRALEQLRDDVRARRAGTHVVHGEDVRVVEGTGRSRFLGEPPQLVFPVRAHRQQLDGDLSAKVQIASEEDAAHAAASELPLDLIAPTEIGKFGQNRVCPCIHHRTVAPIRRWESNEPRPYAR